MKDWHSLVVSPGGEVSVAAAAAWQRQAEILVYGSALAGQALVSSVKPKLANRDSLKKGIVREKSLSVALSESAQDHCIALDQSMRSSCGWGLGSLKPTRAPRPLVVGQRRFRVELSELPHELAQLCGERTCRSAIEDTRSNDTELEVILEPECKWVMNILDQSSSQWGGRCYLSYTAGLRFLHVPDMFHRRSNDCKNALSQVGLNSLRLTASICMNFRMGPWQESGHHHKMIGVLSDYCRTRTIDDPLFVLQYEALSRDMNEGQI
eukprot:4326059-Amphidinium_carterae.1